MLSHLTETVWLFKKRHTQFEHTDAQVDEAMASVVKVQGSHLGHWEAIRFKRHLDIEHSRATARRVAYIRFCAFDYFPKPCPFTT